jgi:autotransporter-associated beta strand protein
MWGAMRDFVVTAVCRPRIVLRALSRWLFIATAASIGAADVQAQTIWNGYSGSSGGVQIDFSTPASVGMLSATGITGSPGIQAAIGNQTGSTGYTFDTGSTGILIDQGIACSNKMITCSGGQYSPGTPGQGNFIGYGYVTLTSSGNAYTGFWLNLPVTMQSSGTTATATAQVPVLVVTASTPGTSATQFGVGFGRPETQKGTAYYNNPVPLSGPTSQDSVIGSLYGRTLNPLLNLTALNGTPIPSSLAPGYVVTSRYVQLGLSQTSFTNPYVALTPSTVQVSSPSCAISGAFTCANSTYAKQATQFDWQTPPMLMQVSGNSAGLSGNSYGQVVVDTGLAVGIISNGTTTSVNQALFNSSTLTQIQINIAGTGANSPAQFIYLYQGVCNSGVASNGTMIIASKENQGCNPGATTSQFMYSNPFKQTIPIYYPTSAGDSYNNGYSGNNTGFSDTSSSFAFLNTGVNFLQYFNIVYDPVNGFIGYVPTGVTSSLVLFKPVLALQSTQQPIPAGTTVPWDIYLFTNPGDQQQISAPVPVVLSVENGGMATFNGVISSDTICTNTTCSTSLSTGLTLSQGTFVLNAQNTYTGATTVQSGATLIVGANGSIATSSGLTVDQGGAVGGIGTLPTTTIYGTLSPGNSIGTINVSGNLTFGSTGTYLVELGPKAADHTHVNATTLSSGATLPGTATLAGTVQAMFAPDTYKRVHYVILRADGGISGTFNALSTNGLPPNFDASLTYTATDVGLDLTAHLGRDVKLPRHHESIANAISNFVNNCVTTVIGSDIGGTSCTLPANFQALFNLTGGNLVNALGQLSGEAATGAQQGAFQLTNQFLGIMLDPFVDGRSGLGGSDMPALGFAPEREPLPHDIALAYAQILKAPSKPQTFEQRWNVWGGAYGGTNRTTGDPSVVGSHDLSARAAGFTAGLDYHLTRDTVIGFALAGGGTGWSLANGLGSGKSDAFQAGVYGATRWGATYLAAAFAFTNHWMSTDRIAFLNDHLSASFTAQSLGGRIESGYRFGTLYGGFAPYAAIQAQSFRTPGYTETDLTNGGFGLSFNSRTATDTRSELGARYDNAMRLDPYRVLAFRARLAWAHDWISDPTLAAVFQTLPGASFIVNGATPAKNSALTSAGAELRVANGLSFLAKFDGEFASHSSTYAGTGTVRYTW